MNEKEFTQSLTSEQRTYLYKLSNKEKKYKSRWLPKKGEDFMFINERAFPKRCFIFGNRLDYIYGYKNVYNVFPFGVNLDPLIKKQKIQRLLWEVASRVNSEKFNSIRDLSDYEDHPIVYLLDILDTSDPVGLVGGSQILSETEIYFETREGAEQAAKELQESGLLNEN